MKNIYKNIIISIIFLSIFATFGYAYSYLRKQKTSSSLNKADNLYLTKSTNTTNTESNITLLDIIKDITIDNSNSIVPYSSDIIIYNSHPDESYESGIKVTDLGALINHKLNAEGLKSSFISSHSNIEYNKSYQISHDSIAQNVIGYENTVLLDIHRNISNTIETGAEMVTFVLAKDNSHFDENNKFAEQLVDEISKSNKITASIYYYDVTNEYLKLNQELSSNSLLVEIGYDKSDDSYIEDCVDELVNALKNIKNI